MADDIPGPAPALPEGASPPAAGDPTPAAAPALHIPIGEPQVHVMSLGGLGEIGKNLWVLEYEGALLVLDAGLMFPSDDMPGIEFILPDISYLLERADKVAGICLSHGHEDHIGAVPYLAHHIRAPLYGTALTMGLVESKLKEFKLLESTEVVTVKPRELYRIGPFEVQFLHVTHSIANGAAVVVRTPLGVIIYTGDFKMDQTPVDGQVSDLYKLAEYGENGVLVLLSDSTNAEKPGFTPSERTVGPVFRNIIARAPGRVLITTFASNIHRIQQAIDAAASNGRRVAIAGRSMERVVRKATELGFLTYPADVLVPASQIDNYEHQQLVILTTGSQGEPMSGLSRMAEGRHKHVNIVEGDTVVISAIPIPGNERGVARIINRLFSRGAEVIYQAAVGTHVSGHGCQEDLKLMLNLTRPQYFIPIHGEYRHLIHHADLAAATGVPDENIFILGLGDVVAIGPEGADIVRKVQAGSIYIDRRSAIAGARAGSLATELLADRQLIVRDGIVFVTATVDTDLRLVAGPQFVSRGFTWADGGGALDQQAAGAVIAAVAAARAANAQLTLHDVQSTMAKALGKILYEQTRRRPIIESLVQELEHPEIIGEVPEEPFLYQEAVDLPGT